MCIIFTHLVGCGGTDKKASLPSSKADPDLFNQGKISGIITFRGSQNPIKGAIIETLDSQTNSQEDGSYLLGPLDAGDYRLIIRSEGYKAKLRESVRVYEGRITQNVNFELDLQTKEHSDDFAVLALLPFTGTDGDSITISCSGIGTSIGEVTFNGVDAEIIDWNSGLDDRITAIVPDEVETGPVRVIIEGQQSSELNPLIFTARPVVFSAEPPGAQPGQVITLKGRNFSTIARQNHVYIGDLLCKVISAPDSNTLRVQLPENATTGIISTRIVTDRFQLDGISNVVVTINPELIYISPRRAVSGVPLTLRGINFGNDKTSVSVLFGDHVIHHSDIITFSDRSLSFNVPGSDIIEPGQSVDIRVQVNDALSNSMPFTLYNPANDTLSEHGIYDFSSVSSGGTLRLATLRPEERIAFLSVLSGTSDQPLEGDYEYYVTALLGGNTRKVPAMSASTAKARRKHSMLQPVKSSHTIRASMTDPASSTIEFYLRDFTSEDPYNYENDILATATIQATGTRCLVYFDENTQSLSPDDAQAIADMFDEVYSKVSVAVWDGNTTPPEGNIDAQPRIVIFVSPLLNEVTGMEPVVAYFDKRDKNPLEPNSAQTEVIYANPFFYTQDIDEFKAGLAISLQRMIYFNQKSQVGMPDSFAGTNWINFGLGIWVRQKVDVGFKQGDQRTLEIVSSFLNNTHLASLNNPSELVYDYQLGLNYLFTQYLYDRCGGSNAIRILNFRNADGFTELLEVDNLIIRPHSNPPSNGLREFFHDFARAVYLDNLGFPTGLPGYKPGAFNFDSINLRKEFSGIQGIRGTTFSETPVITRRFPIKGYTFSLIEYNQGNWGDLEFTIHSFPTAGHFETWVIYYSAEDLSN